MKRRKPNADNWYPLERGFTSLERKKLARNPIRTTEHLGLRKKREISEPPGADRTVSPQKRKGDFGQTLTRTPKKKRA